MLEAVREHLRAEAADLCGSERVPCMSDKRQKYVTIIPPMHCRIH